LKKNKTQYKHTKKNTISPISKTLTLNFEDIKNLKLNGATILDLSKKRKPETLIVVVKKNQ
jgi:hypothetical protein